MAFQVTVSGPRHCTEADEANARRISELLAQRGAIVLCGGRQLGVMGAVGAGVRSANGICIGILPGATEEGASPDLTAVIPSDLGEARNNVLVQSCHALIVVGGSWGTLSELALGMRRGGIPVIVIGGWKLLGADGTYVEGPHIAETPEQAVSMAFSLTSQSSLQAASPAHHLELRPNRAENAPTRPEQA
ncbi:MAG: dethiobiotin synthetase [Candidatus Nephthysia bennettiae]|nr:MAG: dethiobiotin synthetase [Candidatus Dormibacteraeota bacterium]